MAKKSVRNRNARRVELVEAKRKVRDELRAIVSSVHATDKERWDAMIALQKLPRDSSPTRRRNRCKECSRPRAYDRLTGMCRLHKRKRVLEGVVPGMCKSSW